MADSSGQIVYFNKSAKELISDLKNGILVSEILGGFIQESGKPLSKSTPILKVFSTLKSTETIRLGVKGANGIKWHLMNAQVLEGSEQMFLFNLLLDPDHKEKNQRNFGLNLLNEESPIAIHVYDKQATLIGANKAWEKLWGVPREKAVGWYNLLMDKNIVGMGLEKHFKHALKGSSGEFGDVEFSPAVSTLNAKYVSTKYFPLLDDDGKVDRVVVFNEDVTKRVEIQKRLSESEETLTALIQNLHGVTYMISHDPYELIYMNKPVSEITGYPIELFMSGEVQWRKLIKPEDLERLDPVWRGSVQKRRKYTIEYEVKHREGHWVTIRDTGTGVFDTKANLKYVVGYMVDITETKRVQEDIRLNEIKFRSIFENAGHGIAIANSKGVFQEANKRALKLLGYNKGELENKITTLDITHPDDLKSTRERLRMMADGKTRRSTVEKRYVRKDGTAFWVNVSTSTFKNPSTGEIMLVGIIDDISESRQILQNVQVSELKFRSVFEEAGHGIVITNRNFKLLDFNQKFESIVGLTKKASDKERTILDHAHPTYKEPLRDVVRELVNDPSRKIQSEGKLVNKQGEEVWVRNDVSAYIDPHSLETRFVMILEDITRRKTALERLERSEDFQKETIDSLSLGLMVMSTKGQITLTNKVWDNISEKLSQLKSATVGNNFLETIHQMDDRITLIDGLGAVINDESNLFEFEVSLDKNSQSWFVMRCSKLQPKFDSLVITLQEVTVRKRVEQALEESLRNYRNIYNHTPVMMHSIDPQGKLVSVSNFWLEKLGYKRHEVIGKNLRDFLTKESQNDADIILPVFFEKGSIFDVSYHFITKNGDVIETLLSAIEEGKGTAFSRSLAVVTDITLLKKTERELKSNRQDLLQAQSLARIGNFVLNPESRTFQSSPVFDEILEIDSNQQKTFELLPFLTPKGDVEKVIETFDSLFRGGGNLDYTGQAVTLKTKKIIWLECLGTVEMAGDRAVRIVGTIQDITKSKNYELEIEHLSQRLSLAMEGASIGVWELNQIDRIVHYEPTMYELFQLDPPNKFNSWKDLMKVVHPEDEQKMINLKNRIKAGEELVEGDFRLNLKNDTRHFRSVTRQIHGENGLERLLGVITDITSDKELLNRLEVSLYEKDILIKEVHHRVKNNMQMISSILALKSLDLQDEESKKVFDDCTLRVKSMAVVHDQLYRFYNVSEIDISEYLNHLLGSLNALLVGGGGNYKMNIVSDEYLMDVDVALLCGLIVSEIVANAFKHGFKDQDSGEVNVQFKVADDNKHLIVTNSGAKIPGDVLEMKSTSLGMSLIKTFVNQLHGKIQVHPENGLEIIF